MCEKSRVILMPTGMSTWISGTFGGGGRGIIITHSSQLDAMNGGDYAHETRLDSRGCHICDGPVLLWFRPVRRLRRIMLRDRNRAQCRPSEFNRMAATERGCRIGGRPTGGSASIWGPATLCQILVPHGIPKRSVLFRRIEFCEATPPDRGVRVSHASPLNATTVT